EQGTGDRGQGTGKTENPTPNAQRPTPNAQRPTPNPVTALAFSPDSKTLAVGLYREVQFWDVEKKQKISVWRGHKDAVRALAYTKDARWLAAGGGLPAMSGEIRLWDTAAGREIRVLGEHTDNVTAISFNPDGTKLASASADRTVRIWDVAAGKTLF